MPAQFEKDHIQPKTEGGTNDPENLRTIPWRENRSKGARMPNVDEVLDSSNPGLLAGKIDHDSVTRGFHNHRNVGRGFGGLQKR